MSSFNPGWPPASNLAGKQTYHSPEINFGASQIHSMDQAFNSLIPSHTVAEQHQWNAGDHFFLQATHPSILAHPNYSTQPDFRTRRAQRALGSRVSLRVLLEITRVVFTRLQLRWWVEGRSLRCWANPRLKSLHSRHAVLDQWSAIHGASGGVQSQANRQALPLAGSPSQRPIPPQTEPQAVPSHPRSEPVVNGIRTSLTNDQATQMRNENTSLAASGRPTPESAPDELNHGQGEGNVRCASHFQLSYKPFSTAFQCARLDYPREAISSVGGNRHHHAS